MLEYNRIDISEGIDINKCEETSRRCSLCKFYYFLDKNFYYGPLCNGYYDMSLKAVSMSSNIWGYLGRFGSKFPNF